MTLLPCLDGSRLASGLARLFIWGSNLGIPAPCLIPWSDCTTNLVLKISKATGLDYYLGAAGRSLVYQDLNAECCKPLLCHRFPVVKLCRFLCSLCEARPKWGLLSDPQHWGNWISTLGSFPIEGNCRSRLYFLAQWYASLGRSNMVNILPLFLPLYFGLVLVSGEGRCFSLTPMFSNSLSSIL